MFLKIKLYYKFSDKPASNEVIEVKILNFKKITLKKIQEYNYSTTDFFNNENFVFFETNEKVKDYLHEIKNFLIIDTNKIDFILKRNIKTSVIYQLLTKYNILQILRQEKLKNL